MNKSMLLTAVISLILCVGAVVPNEGLPHTDVLIDVGHGGIDSGTTYGSLYEKKINLEIALLTYNLLVEKGIHTIINRTDDRALSEDNTWLPIRSRHLRDLAQRKQLANDLKPQIMVSLHVNWTSVSHQKGPFVLYQRNEQSKQLAERIQQSLNDLYETANKPYRGKTYYLLNHTKCPTVIVEMGYISHKQDRERLTHPQTQKEIAAAICSAIEKYLASTKLPDLLEQNQS